MLTLNKYIKSEYQQYLGILLIILITIISYIPAIQGGFIWDDDDYVTENTTLRSLTGLKQIWFKIGAVPQYYPLVHTTFWIEYHLWNLNPLGYHIINVLLHIINALLLWRILKYLSIPGAWFAALIFAIHPVHVESVAWVTERKNVLSGLFYLFSVLFFLKFKSQNIKLENKTIIPKQKTKGKKRRHVRNPHLKLYILSLVLFICALLSKTITVTMPAIILLIIWWKYHRIIQKDVMQTIPFFMIGGTLSLITVWMEKNIVGAKGHEWSLNLIERCLIAGRAVWFYIIKLILPYKLTFNYPRWEIDHGVVWQYLFPLALLAGIFLLLRYSKKIGKGPIIAILYFTVTLSPALGFIDVFPMRYSYVADHFQYLSSTGIIVLLTSGIAWILKNRPRVYKISGIVLFTVISSIFASITWKQGYVYKDQETLWRDTLLKNPDSWMAHTHLGTILHERGENEKAIEHHKKCIAINPDYDGAYNSLGMVYHTLGMNDEALEEYKNALRVNPEYYRAHNNIGVIYEERGLYEQAISEYKKAIIIKPGYDIAHCHMGNTFLKMGYELRALQAYKNALSINPENEDAKNNIELVYKNIVEQYVNKIETEPNNTSTRFDLGIAHAIKGNLSLAVKQWREVLKIDPNHKQAHVCINRALKIMGKK